MRHSTPKKSYIHWLVILSITALICVFTSCNKDRRINKVIVVTIDALRADHLECYGYVRKTSPFLDSIAEKGIQFKNALSQSSHTTPSHASIFTSLYPFQHGVLRNGNRVDDELLTLAGFMRKHGFETAAFTSVKFLRGLKNGFDVFYGKRRRGGKTINHVIEWLEDKTKQSKFFLWVHLFDVHQWKYDKDLNEMTVQQMAIEDPGERDNFLRFLPSNHNIPPWLFKNNNRLMKAHQRYDGQLLFVDQQLERLFNWMENKGFNKSTLWIFTSDHGEGLGNHNLFGHGKYIYNEQLHVPLIFYFGNSSYSGEKIQSLVQLVDIFPTIVEIAGISLDKDSHLILGSSLLPLIKQDVVVNSPQLGFAERRPKDKNKRKNWEKGEIVSLQNLEYKYIFHSHGKDEYYDLLKDPFETKNLIDSEDAGENQVKKSLKKKILKILNTKKMFSKKKNIKKMDEETIKELKSLGYL